MRRMKGLPIYLRKPIRDLLAAGGRISRDGNQVLIEGPLALADAVRTHADELARYVVPSVDAKEAELVRSLLADAGAAVAYIIRSGRSPAGGGRDRRWRPGCRWPGF